MKSLRIFLLVLFQPFLGAAQTVADVDTFIVNGAQFIITTPVDWFSISIKDSIQNDTTWNYKMRYAPKQNPNNLAAEIWIHIVNNSNYNPSKKEEKQFKRNCKVTQRKLGNWPGYFLNYKGQKVPDCSKCGLIYNQSHFVPLNSKQSLEIIFVGQGSWSKLYPLSINYSQFASDFVKSHDQSLSTFRVINFYQPMTAYNMLFDQSYARVFVPSGFIVLTESVSSGSTKVSGRNLFITVTGQSVLGADSLSYKLDTSITIEPIRMHSFGTVGTNVAKLVTHRKLKSPTGSWVILKFAIDIPQVDAALLEYYKTLLLDYANYTVSHQCDFAIVIPPLTLPALEQGTGGDLNKDLPPLKFDKLDQRLPNPKRN